MGRETLEFSHLASFGTYKNVHAEEYQNAWDHTLIRSPWIRQLIMKQRMDEGFNEKNQTLIKNGSAPSTKDTAGKCVLLKFGVRRCRVS